MVSEKFVIIHNKKISEKKKKYLKKMVFDIDMEYQIKQDNLLGRFLFSTW